MDSGLPGMQDHVGITLSIAKSIGFLLWNPNGGSRNNGQLPDGRSPVRSPFGAISNVFAWVLKKKNLPGSSRGNAQVVPFCLRNPFSWVFPGTSLWSPAVQEHSLGRPEADCLGRFPARAGGSSSPPDSTLGRLQNEAMGNQNKAGGKHN